MPSQLQRNHLNQLLRETVHVNFTKPIKNKFIEQLNSLNPEQFGLRPNARTADSLFILCHLHKLSKQHKKRNVGFINHEKAFDSIWQCGMIHKLYKYGIRGKF